MGAGLNPFSQAIIKLERRPVHQIAWEVTGRSSKATYVLPKGNHAIEGFKFQRIPAYGWVRIYFKFEGIALRQCLMRRQQGEQQT